MANIDDIQILDDIELEGVVGGVKKKKVAKKKKATKKKVAKKKAAKKSRKGYATSNGGATVYVSQNALDNANGLTPI